MLNNNFARNSSIKNYRIIENMTDAKPLDYFNLSGNLKLAGSIRATDFIKEDGTTLDTVTKLALPRNVYWLDNKLGINQESPIADFDVKGKARVQGELNVDGQMGVSGHFIGQSANFGSNVFAKGHIMTEDELTVGKAANFGSNVFAKGRITSEDELSVGRAANFGSNVFAKGHIMTEDELSVGKAANFGSNVFAKGHITAEDELSVGRAANFGSNVFAKGRITAEDELSVGRAANFGSTIFAKGRITAEDELSVGRSANFGGSLLARGLVQAEDDLNVGKNVSIGGTLGINGTITTPANHTIASAGRQHITGTELLYLLNKNGVVIGKEWGGSGNLQAQGSITAQDELTVGTTANFGGRVNLSNALLLNSDIPHPDVGDGAFYRADGQVQIATDDLIRLRHVGSKATGIQFDVREGAGDINTPNGQMKITRQGIMFGGPNNTREVNSAQISAGLHVANSLNIVGMSADTSHVSRRIDMWAEGGLNVYGPGVVNGNLTAGNITTAGSLTAGTLTVNSNADRWIASNFGEASNKDRVVIGNLTNKATVGAHNAQLNAWKPLYLNSDGDQPVVVGPAGICIGSTCIREDKLRELITGNNNSRRNNNMYLPEDAVIYQNVFDALTTNVIAKSGTPTNWNDTSFVVNPWNGFKLLHIGTKNAHPNGLLVRVPANKNVIWLRSLADRWQSFEVYTEAGASLGNFTTGFRKSNKYCPDGSLSDSLYDFHSWMPIPVPGPGNYIICGGNKKNDGGNDCWISGVAFSSNPWNHATNSAVAYHWIVNEGTPNPTWVNQDINGDQIAKLEVNQEYTLMVPVVKSGKDKLLYIVELNNPSTLEEANRLDYTAPKVSITVNDAPIERLRTTYNNPFARHYNTNINKFFAARIPDSVVTNARFLTIKINTRNQIGNIYFREIGTIDIE